MWIDNVFVLRNEKMYDLFNCFRLIETADSRVACSFVLTRPFSN